MSRRLRIAAHAQVSNVLTTRFVISSSTTTTLKHVKQVGLEVLTRNLENQSSQRKLAVQLPRSMKMGIKSINSKFVLT